MAARCPARQDRASRSYPPRHTKENDMANNLNADITDKYVVLRESAMSDDYKAMHWRIFHAEGGFGVKPDTMGRAVFGTFVADGEQALMEGFHIERYATDTEVAIAHAYRVENEAAK